MDKRDVEEPKLKEKLVRRLLQIPGLTHQPFPDREDGFSAIHLGEKEIGHFHNFHEIDLRLGKRLIKAEGLAHPPDSSVHPNRSPGSQFIEVRFHNDQDVCEIVRLVELLAQGPSIGENA